MEAHIDTTDPRSQHNTVYPQIFAEHDLNHDGQLNFVGRFGCSEPCRCTPLTVVTTRVLHAEYMNAVAAHPTLVSFVTHGATAADEGDEKK